MTVVRTPPDLLKFVSIEHEQFLVSLTNNRDRLEILSHIQGLYDAAMANVGTTEDKLVIFQLLTFTHYHFLFSAACFMRCHLSEAFASARAAIDGALVSAWIIHDRASQIAYVKREKPFDKLVRRLKECVRNGKALPHRLVPELLKLYDAYSSIASHADIKSFAHRLETSGEPDNPMLTVEYFQFAKNDIERKIHAITILYTFVLVLDVFSDFLVVEHKGVPIEWQNELHELRDNVQRYNADLKETLPDRLR